MTEAEPETPVPAPKKKRSETADFMIFLVKLAVFVFVFRSFITAPFNIPSESMMPRLLVGDYLLVSKWNYGYSRYSLPYSLPLLPNQRIMARQPERGDVVVFKAPPYGRQDYIKRVIGLPGDMIQIRAGQIILNGTPVPRERIADYVLPVKPYSRCLNDAIVETAGDTQQCRYPRYRETLPNGKSYDVLDTSQNTAGDDTEVYNVPEGSVFLMGDNRDHSADSRFPAQDGGAIGIVPQDNLVGKAWISVFSTDGTANWFLPWTWFSAARWERIGERF